MGVQKRGLVEIAAGLAILSLVLGAVAAKVEAQNIRAPSKIVRVTSTIPDRDRRFPLRQIHDGITSDAAPHNGFVGPAGQLGSITFTLNAKYDMTQFHIWNDIAVRAEGIENFTLRFFSDGQPMHAQSFSERNAVKAGVTDMQTFRLSRTVKNVNRVILRVDSLLKRKNTFAHRLEVREVAFSGRLSAIVRSEEQAAADNANAADEKAKADAIKAAEDKAKADAIKKAEEDAAAEALALAQAEAEKFSHLEMVHQDIPDYEPGIVLFFSRSSETELREIAANNGLTVRAITDLDQIALKMVSARIEPGDVVAEALDRLNANGAVEWAEPNIYFQLLGDPVQNSRSGGLAMHGLLFGESKKAPPMNPDATIVLIDSPIDVGNENFMGARIEQRAYDVPDIPSPHGTAIAEMLVGTKDFMGVAQGARLVSFPAFKEVDKKFLSTSETLATAMNAASAMRPHVVNMSFGADAESLVLGALLKKMTEYGICLASAAGNNKDKPVLFPANHDATVAITAVEQSKRLYRSASRGAEVNVAAWGVSMNAAVPGGRRPVSGTSFATALVSGAMLRMPACTDARNPALMRTAIEGDAENLGDPNKFGAGLFRLGALSLAATVKSEEPAPQIVLPEKRGVNGTVNPIWYAAGGAGAAGGGMLFFLAWRRRKKTQSI